MTYFQIPALSNSSLNVFNYDPSYYYKVYITKEIEEKKESAALTFGSLVHCLILEEDKFNEQYVISSLKPEDKPSGMMLDFVNALLKFEIYDDIAIDAAYAQSGYKINKEKVLENFNKSAKTYYEEQLECKGKSLITQAEYDLAVKAKQIAIDNPQWLQILGAHEKLWDTFNELEIYWNWDNSTPCKSKIDMLKIRKEGTTVFVKMFDIKTDSQKPVHKYLETFEYWKTYRQMAFYRQAVYSWILENYLSTSEQNYTIIFSAYIVAIDVVRFKSLIYYIDQSYLFKGLEEIKENINNLQWHLTNNLWEYPKSVYQSLQTGSINLVDLTYYERLNNKS